MKASSLAAMALLVVAVLALWMAAVVGTTMLLLWLKGQHGFEVAVIVALAVLIVGQMFNGSDD